MKITHYTPQVENNARIVKSEREIFMSVASNSGDKGTFSNPWSVTEYIYLYLNGAWPGGFVENAGYVGKDEHYIDFSEFDLVGYFSDVFSFLSGFDFSGFSLPVPSSSSSSTSKSNRKSTEGTPSNENTYLVNVTAFLDGIQFDISLVIGHGWVLMSSSAQTRQPIKNGQYYIEYVIDGKCKKLDLNIYSKKTDGTITKYIFDMICIPYAYGERNIYLCSNVSGKTVTI